MLVLTPKGFYLVEIKSRPGLVDGDQGTWTWRDQGRVHTLDNPLLLANRKAKKLDLASPPATGVAEQGIQSLPGSTRFPVARTS